jgi:hypothetical protein
LSKYSILPDFGGFSLSTAGCVNLVVGMGDESSG